MKIFRKKPVEHEQVKQQAEQNNGESESITIFKEYRKRKGALQDKGKSLYTPKHGKA